MCLLKRALRCPARNCNAVDRLLPFFHHHARPYSVQDMMAFLGLANYHRAHIPDFTSLTESLRGLIQTVGYKDLKKELIWTLAAEQSFIDIKTAISQAVSLACPDYTKTFHLDVVEKDGICNAILFQQRGEGRARNDRSILYYYSVKLDSMERGQPACTKAAAAIAIAIQKTSHVVMNHPLVVLSEHGVVSYVQSSAFSMTQLRRNKLLKVLMQPHITFESRDVLMSGDMNPFPLHECEEKVREEVKYRKDLKFEPLTGDGVRKLFTDGCCYRDMHSGTLRAGFAVREATDEGGFTTLHAEKNH